MAHRLKSKFFLIDGTVVAGFDSFYRKVSHVFEEAKRNAPAVVFIDDADVIFEDKDEHGFYRYLLTMLDGLEGAGAEKVCVMMTAMDMNSLPEAMVRSGRIELWLETKLPDNGAGGDPRGEACQTAFPHRFGRYCDARERQPRHDGSRPENCGGRCEAALRTGCGVERALTSRRGVLLGSDRTVQRQAPGKTTSTTRWVQRRLVLEWRNST